MLWRDFSAFVQINAGLKTILKKQLPPSGQKFKKHPISINIFLYLPN
jgi:hypothetical protein